MSDPLEETTINAESLAQLSPFKLRVAGFTAEIRVVRFRGRERVSHPFRFDLEITVHETDAAGVAALLGAAATLEIQLPNGDTRRVCGVLVAIDAATSLDRARQRQGFRLYLAPKLSLLQYRRTSRIFQEQTVPDIVAAVLDAAQVPHRSSLVAKYPKRVYCVQYQETDLAFVTRVLAEEGIFYFFEHGADGEKMVLGDSAAAYVPIAGDAKLAYRATREALVPQEHHVGPFVRSRALQTRSVLHRDYDFRRPKLDLRAASKDSSEVQIEGELEVYDHELGDDAPAVDAKTAGLRLEQHRRGADGARGESACRRLLPGATFELTEHEVGAADGTYVVERIDHRGTTPVFALDKMYENTFRCRLADVPLRPKRPKRRTHQVTETAVVVGPKGQEIHTDEHGRVKVQFPWDLQGKHDDKSSCWIRVSQAWAGSGWGFQFIPRVGMEVVVTFLGGDPDRPLITGCVPNPLNGSPFTLPQDKTKSGIRTQTTPHGGGSNELSFQDAAGKERIYLHAQRDLDEVIERNHTGLVRADELIRVLGNRMDMVEKNLAQLVKGDHTSHVEGNRIDVVTGNSEEQVSGMLVTRVEGRERRDVTKATDLNYLNDLTTRVEGCVTTIVGKSDAKRSWQTHAEGTAKLSSLDATEVSSQKELTLRVGKSSIRITSEKIEIQSPAVTVKGAGGGMSADDAGLKISSKGDAQLLVEHKLVIKSKDGASLSMQKEVKVDGSQILLNSPEQAHDPPPAPPDPPTTVVFKDHLGKTLPYQRFLITMPDGSEVSGLTDKDGNAEMDLKMGGKVTFPDLSKAK